MHRPRVIRALLAVVMLAVAARAGQSPQRPSATPSGEASPSYRRVFNLLQAGKAAEALAEIDAALAKSPRDPALYNLRGLTAGQLGRVKEAEASFRKVIELSPRSAMGYNNLAVLLSKSGRSKEAADLFQTSLKLEPRNFTALLGLGVTLSALQRYSDAAPFLEKAWTAQPADFRAGYEYARVLRELKRPTEAQKALKRLATPENSTEASKFYALSAVVAEDQGNRADAVRLYRRAYELSPESFDLYLALARSSLDSRDGAKLSLPPAPTTLSAEQHFALGLLFASHDDFADAVPHFEETLRERPSSYAATYNLALAYKGAGNDRAAIEFLSRALKEKPTAEMCSLLASIEESGELYLDAVRHYQQAVELEPSNEQYYFDLGVEFLAHFTFDPALQVFQVAVKEFPRSARLFVGLGLAHYAVRQYLEAAEAFLSALEIDPSSPTALAAWNALPSFLAGSELETILPRLERLAESSPTNAAALYCYGVTLFRRSVALNRPQELDQAQALLEKTVRLKPEFADARLELGNIYAARRENQKAIAEFREAVRLNPRSDVAHYRLGQTYRNMNQLELAQQELAHYAEMTRNRRALMARNRAAIQQFVLAKPNPSPSTQQRGLENESR